MNHGSSVFCQPDDFAFNRCADSGIEFGQLNIGLRAYFDAVGHET